MLVSFNMVLASDKHCGMFLVSRTVFASPPNSPHAIARLTTLSANVKCSCSGPGSQ